ncbi:MAG: zinc ABC transporter substrate-binding protein, partial [Thermodesulfobacteriota bacterium]
HAHTGVAFTTWLDPLLAIEQANAIKEAFIKLMPGKKEIFETNFQSLKKVLSDLDKAMSAIVSKDPDKPLVASHPVYQYLARRYNLNLKSVQWEPDVFPVLNQWKELGVILESNPSHWMIWEDTPIKETTERLESIEINSIVFNPCGNIPENGDYISVMKQNVENLKIVF